MKAKAKLETEKANGEKEDKDVKGVPEFWLTIFKNVDMLQEMVQDHDEPALKALKDITVTFAEKPMGFTLHFHFAANDFFSDSVLTKEYFMKCEPSEDDPFSFEGPEIVKCKGCPINWKQGKNLTVKTVKTKQKHKSKGSVRTITKTVKNDSFFNFFDPPACEENEEDMDPMTQDLLTADFEIGHYVRERIIPRAVLFFTGEALEDDFDEDEEEESGDEEGEEEEDDPDFVPGKGGKGKAGEQECKQQWANLRLSSSRHRVKHDAMALHLANWEGSSVRHHEILVILHRHLKYPNILVDSPLSSIWMTLSPCQCVTQKVIDISFFQIYKSFQGIGNHLNLSTNVVLIDDCEGSEKSTISRDNLED